MKQGNRNELPAWAGVEKAHAIVHVLVGVADIIV